MLQPKGIITAMVTPFNKDESIDYLATEKLINRLINEGIHGIFILGTNGEFHVMDADEKVDVAKKVVEIVNHRVPVYAGAGGNGTNETVSLANKLAMVGVDALSVISPFFVRLNDEELYHHYYTIAKSVSVPILLYNIPKNTGMNLSPDLVKKLAKEDNIVGIKDSSGDLQNIINYISVSKDEDFSVLSGSDSLILKALNEGATGAVAATSNVLTKNNLGIYQEYQNGNLGKAQEWQESLEEFRRILKFGSIPSVLKKSIELTGIEVGVPKKPVLPINNQENLVDIKQVIESYDL